MLMENIGASRKASDSSTRKLFQVLSNLTLVLSKLQEKKSENSTKINCQRHLRGCPGVPEKSER